MGTSTKATNLIPIFNVVLPRPSLAGIVPMVAVNYFFFHGTTNESGAAFPRAGYRRICSVSFYLEHFLAKLAGLFNEIINLFFVFTRARGGTILAALPVAQPTKAGPERRPALFANTVFPFLFHTNIIKGGRRNVK